MEESITIETRKPELMTCDLCGKTDETVDLYVGPFTYLCPECEEIADKIIKGYLEFLANLPFRLVVNELIAHIQREKEK